MGGVDDDVRYYEFQITFIDKVPEHYTREQLLDLTLLNIKDITSIVTN